MKEQRINQFSYYKSIVALSPDKSILIKLPDRNMNIAFNQIRSLYFWCSTLCLLFLIYLIEGNGPVSVKQQDDVVGVRG
jgi:hypothetical protein